MDGQKNPAFYDFSQVLASMRWQKLPNALF
jgi:hypothetical protein